GGRATRRTWRLRATSTGCSRTSSLIRELEEAAGLDAVAPAAELALYAGDRSTAAREPPEVVVRPASAEGVARVLAVASRRRVPVVPMGGRSGLAGGANPRGGGIALSLEWLDAIGPVDRENLRVAVGAGARTVAVHEAALAAGLFYPPDPASRELSTIGG